MIVLAMPGAVTRPRPTPALAAAVMRPRVRGSSMLLAPIRLSILRSSSVSPAMLEALLRSRLITPVLAMPLTTCHRLFVCVDDVSPKIFPPLWVGHIQVT